MQVSIATDACPERAGEKRCDLPLLARALHRGSRHGRAGSRLGVDGQAGRATGCAGAGPKAVTPDGWQAPDQFEVPRFEAPINRGARRPR
jgi:hypothetical protein